VTDSPKLEFAHPGPLRDQLVAAVLSGEKTATTSLAKWYTEEGEEMPVVGQRQVMVDSDERPVGVVEVTAVEVIRLGDADLRLAIDEGEGFESVAQWREAHEAFWRTEGVTDFDDDLEVLVERFRLVERR
jgi:uncharacterized protein YhfF